MSDIPHCFTCDDRRFISDVMRGATHPCPDCRPPRPLDVVAPPPDPPVLFFNIHEAVFRLGLAVTNGSRAGKAILVWEDDLRSLLRWIESTPEFQAGSPTPMTMQSLASDDGK